MVPRGGCTVLLGPAGAGKTGVLRLLAGLASPDQGRVLLDGAELDRQPAAGAASASSSRSIAMRRRSRTVERLVTEPVLGLAGRRSAPRMSPAR